MSKTKLIVLRGPSGSGKSSVAMALRNLVKEKIAIVQQDYLRRTLLKEKDVSNSLNAELIQQVTLFVLDHGYHVIMEGIFDSDRYKNMFEKIIRAHSDNNYFFYFDVSFKETLRRHQSKPNKEDFGEKELRSWYKERDYLPFVREEIIPEGHTLEKIVELIRTSSSLP